LVARRRWNWNTPRSRSSETTGRSKIVIGFPRGISRPPPTGRMPPKAVPPRRPGHDAKLGCCPLVTPVWRPVRARRFGWFSRVGQARTFEHLSKRFTNQTIRPSALHLQVPKRSAIIGKHVNYKWQWKSFIGKTLGLNIDNSTTPLNPRMQFMMPVLATPTMLCLT